MLFGFQSWHFAQNRTVTLLRVRFFGALRNFCVLLTDWIGEFCEGMVVMI